MTIAGRRSVSCLKRKRELKFKFGSETYINEIVSAFPRAACQELILVQAKVIHET